MAVVEIAAIPGEMGIPWLVLREASAAVVGKDWPALFGVLRWGTSPAITGAVALAVAVTGRLLMDTGETVTGGAITIGAPLVLFFAFARTWGSALQALWAVILARRTLPPASARALTLLSSAVSLGMAFIWLCSLWFNDELEPARMG